jgi:hypothetical protein
MKSRKSYIANRKSGLVVPASAGPVGRLAHGAEPQTRQAWFANSESSAELVAFTNQIAIANDGWAQLAPFGDYPGQALLRGPDGVIRKFGAIQRLDRVAAELMTARFKSPWNRVKRYFTGCHIYAGHPDVPAFANEYPDKTPKGMIVDLQVRDDGLFCRPVFTNEGSELVETGKLRAFSAYWSAREIGEQAGPGGRPLKIYRPDFLKSAGLTNHPNLPVQLLNEAQPANPSPVKKQIVIEFLAGQGITLAPESADEQIADALRQIGDRVATAETTLAARSLELANERRFHLDTLLDHALAAGRITPAQRPEWAARLETDFVNASAALAQLAPVLKTRALTLNLGGRKAEIAGAGERRDALETLVRAEMANNGGHYDQAFAAVQNANPALFDAMKQPGK